MINANGLKEGKSGNVIVGSLDLRPSTKLSSSAVSALSPFSGSGNQNSGSATLKPNHLQQQQYCLKSSTNSDSNNMNSSLSYAYYSPPTSQYSHPPTADLLGTGYQSTYQQRPFSNSNMYHQSTIPANLGSPHTTRLVWQAHNQQHQHQQHQNNIRLGGNDAGFYMPTSQTGQSESGSLYQTIY